MSWLLLVASLFLLVALPVTFAAVAARPSHATIRAAAVALLAVPVVVILILVAGIMA